MPSPTPGSVSYASLLFYDATVSISRPSGAANGNVLLLIGYVRPGTANMLNNASLPSGFTNLFQPVSGFGIVGWRRITDITTEPTSYTVTRQGGSGQAALSLQLVTGVDTATPIATAGIGFSRGTSGTTATYPTFSAPADSLVFYLAAADAEGSYGPTTASGLTHRWQINDWAVGSGDDYTHQITLKSRSITTAETTAAYTQTSSTPVTWNVAAVVVKSVEPTSTTGAAILLGL